MNIVRIATTLLALAPASSFAQDDDVERPKKDAPWTAAATEFVDRFTVAAASDPERALARDPEPVFQHVQHVRFNATGSVFLWREATGRPAAICDVFFFPYRDRIFTMQSEWHSLASVPLSVKAGGPGNSWRPQGPGLEWHALPEAPAPDETAQRRSQQVRRLARRFTSHIVDREGDRYELRLITRPLALYETKGSEESLGGGLFAFCQENDPETLLLIEARTTAAGPRWEYAVAEFSNLEQHVDLDGNEVWKAAPPTFSSSGPHTAIHGGRVEIPLAREEAE